MAKKENMLQFMDQMIDQYIDGAYEVEIDWQPRTHRIEVFCRLFAENKNELAIVDVEEVTAAEVIEFEDQLLFYDSKQKVEADNYLQTFSFDRKRGMKKAEIAAIFKTLRTVLDEGQSDLLDFMTDEDALEFELHWLADEWRSNQLEAEKEYGNDLVAYPKF